MSERQRANHEYRGGGPGRVVEPASDPRGAAPMSERQRANHEYRGDLGGIRIGYGSNGFGDHPIETTLDVLAGMGYRAVALTLGFPHLDPFAADAAAQVRRLAARLADLDLRVVVETGTRYLLDPLRKHRPTLVDRDAARRIDYLRRAVDIAAELRAECVSLWSGVLPAGVDADEGWDLLRVHLSEVVTAAADRDVRLGFEPEPGMLVETVDDVLRLRSELGDPPGLGITVDLGHCVVVEPGGVAAALRKAGPLLVNVQVDDMLPAAHEHLEFGDGSVDLPLAVRTLTEIGYRGVAAVELPRHSHDAPGAAARARTAWRQACRSVARTTSGPAWLDAACTALSADPAVFGSLYTEAARRVGRDLVDPDSPFGPTRADLARVDLFGRYVRGRDDEQVAHTLLQLYQHGDGGERRGVLLAVAALPEPGPHTIRAGVDITLDALRTNDTGLVAAAMGPFAAAHLDRHDWRHGVLKLLFMGVPTTAAADLDTLADPELHRMAHALLAERRAAGRPVSSDIATLAAPFEGAH